MQVDPKLHNLWLQCCVGVIRAAWAAHDAAVEDRRAAVAPLLPVMARDGAEVPAAPRPQQPQTEVRSLVASFCAIVPNRRQQEQGGRNGRVRPAVGAHSGGSASEDSDSDELPPLGSLGELAWLHCAGQSSSSASNGGNGTHQSVVATLVAARSGSDPRARLHPQNKHRAAIGAECSCCDTNATLTVEHALSCAVAWQHPVVEEAFGTLLDLIPSLKLGRALVPPVIASAENVDALRSSRMVLTCQAFTQSIQHNHTHVYGCAVL